MAESGRRALSVSECAWQVSRNEEGKKRFGDFLFELSARSQKKKRGRKKLAVAAYREDAGRAHGSLLARVAHLPGAARNYEAHKVRPTGCRSCRL